MRRRHAHVVLMALWLICVGCYSYLPVQSPQPGMEVRARLNTEAAVRRSQGLEEPVVRLDGIVVEASSQALSLDVLVARSSSVFQNVTLRDTVRLETSEIQSLLARKFSPVRTVVFTAGALAGAFVIVKGIEQVVGGTGEDPGDGTPALTVPLFTFRLLQRAGQR